MIREGDINDAQAIANIFNHYVVSSPVIFSNTTLSVEDMRQKLTRLEVGSRFPFLVAEIDGQVAGYAYAHLWMPDPVYDKSWEVTIYLSREAAGHGLGSEMLKRLVDMCRQAGAHTLVSFITEGNSPSEKIHLKNGFKFVGVIPESGFKFGKYYNDAIYQIIF